MIVFFYNTIFIVSSTRKEDAVNAGRHRRSDQPKINPAYFEMLVSTAALGKQ